MAEYQFPDFGPWASNPQDCLWIKISACKYEGQTSNIRSSDAQVRVGATEGVFKFLAPNDIQLNLDHSWENYENITSRMANVISNWMIPWQDLKNAAGNFSPWADVKNLLSGNWDSKKTGMDTLSGKLSSMLSGDVINYRVDAPLVYKGTQNLEYNFNFELAVYQASDYEKIENAIIDLMKFSSPKKIVNNVLSITPPHIFKIESIPKGIIKLQYAALKTVQPELSYPFVKGKPTSCKLQLTFQDITPLFDSTFETGSSVTVTSDAAPRAM
ncbi:MAG: hypothetical protein WC503_00750 [Candidatus Shapirobacteria bacterium]